MTNCVRCHQDKPKSHFYARQDYPAVFRVCKECHKAYQRNRSKQLPNAYRKRYLSRYGLTVEQYKAMFDGQLGKCAMCSSTQKRALSVDHHHESGRVRSLLCGSCNALLGFAKEDRAILLAAIEYLDRHELDK